MKKGDMIQVKQNAKYDGRTMNWTETRTATKKLESGTFFHVSGTKLQAFLPKETCFADKKYGEGYYYAMKIIAPVIVDFYDDDEIRIDLEEYSENVEIYYIGTITGKNTNKMINHGKYGFSPERIRKDLTVKIK